MEGVHMVGAGPGIWGWKSLSGAQSPQLRPPEAEAKCEIIVQFFYVFLYKI